MCYNTNVLQYKYAVILDNKQRYMKYCDMITILKITPYKYFFYC